MEHRTRVVTVGGGGGHAQVLKALRTSDVTVTAICPSTDSGGSTGALLKDYQSFGYLGDLTKCIAALCPDINWASAMMYRYIGGCLDGHSVKNLLFLGLEKQFGLHGALTLMYRVCGLGDNQVLPVTAERTELCAKLRMGNDLIGEANIDTIARNPLWHPEFHEIMDVYLVPPAPVLPEASTAVRNADWCVICPGDLYTSILPVLLPDGMKDSFSESKARIVIVLNIMTKRGETQRYGAADFVKEIERRIGREAEVIIGNNAPVPDEVAAAYAMEQKVQLDPSSMKDRRIREAPMITIEGGQLCHSPEVLAGELQEVFSLVPA